MFDVKSPAAPPIRALVAVAILGFQFWYLFNVGFTDVLKLSPYRDASLLRGAVLLGSFKASRIC